MFEIVIEEFLTLAQAALAAAEEAGWGGAAATVVTKIITGLNNLVPVIAQSAPQFLTEVQAIMTTLGRIGENATPEQVAAQTVLNATVDAAFDAAAKAAGATESPPASS